jgi:hypothetical protein
MTRPADSPLIDAVLEVRKPYVLFLGDVTDSSDAKTAFGLRDWCRRWLDVVADGRSWLTVRGRRLRSRHCHHPPED